MTDRGEPLSSPSARTRPELWVPALGAWLAAIHAGPTEGLTVWSAAELLERALARLASGDVDIGALDRAYRTVSADTLATQLAGACPPEHHAPVPLAGPDLLDHVCFDGSTATSTRVPVAAGDAYLDLGPMAGQLARLVGPEALGVFFESYGNPAPDARRLDFYLLLDAVSDHAIV